jgi:transcriptional/translational regulatory protein YebC/TACO1
MITCAFKATGALSSSLEERFGEARSVRVIWKPQVTAPLDAAGADSIMKLITQLDDDDDVQAVFTNFEVDDATMAKLTES